MKGNAFLAWVLGGAGVVLLYSAYKNVGPISLVTGTLSGDTSRTTIDSTTGGSGSGSSNGPTTGNSDSGSSAGSIQRSKDIMDGKTSPTLVLLPSQPNIRLDVQAAASWMNVQADYGKRIPLTGGYRSESAQAAGHASDPSRFSAKSAHPKGLAVDIDTNQTNVNDPKLEEVLTKHNWYRVGRSGKMHASYGVPA